MEDVIEFFFSFNKLRWKKGCIGFSSRNGSETSCTITNWWPYVRHRSLEMPSVTSLGMAAGYASCSTFGFTSASF